MIPAARALVVVLVAALVGACATVPGAATTSGPRASAPPPTATAEVSARPTPVPGEPAATLRARGLGPIAGTVGSWAIDGAGSDAPWLPASMLSSAELAPNALVSIAFDDGAAIGVFSVTVAAAGDIRGQSRRGIRARDTARPPLVAIDLPPLPRGDWILAAQLVRADDRGEATFYWSIHVP